MELQRRKMSSDKRSPESSAALRRLLSSHHSIYNTLTDPLLECTLPLPPPSPHLSLKDGGSKHAQYESTKANDKIHHGVELLEFLSPALEDSLASFLSWQSLNLSSFHDIAKLMRISSPFSCNISRPASASILSNSTDEELHSDSLVFVPSLKKQISPQVLLFETDEEDEADDDIPFANGDVKNPEVDYGRPTITFSNSQRNSVRTDLLQTFIMPKMLLSEDIGTLQLTMVSSEGETVINEIQFLMESILASVTSRLTISHIILGKIPLQEEVYLARNSDLLLAINDGCVWISVLVESMVDDKSNGNSLPLLLVVNLLTSNYFANLFEIIRKLRPSQSLKSVSLKNRDFLEKIKGLIDEELRKAKINAIARKFSPENATFLDEITSMYKTFGDSINKPDYRNIERTIRHEMIFAPDYHSVDPLKLSSSLSHLTVLVNSLSDLFMGGSCDGKFANLSPANRETLWFVCSFSVGVGLGITLNAFHVFKVLRRTLFITAPPPPETILRNPTKGFLMSAMTEKFSNIADKTMSHFEEFLTGMVRFFSQFGLWTDLSLDGVLQECRAMGDIALYSAINGFLKFKSIISGLIE